MLLSDSASEDHVTAKEHGDAEVVGSPPEGWQFCDNRMFAQYVLKKERFHSRFAPLESVHLVTDLCNTCSKKVKAKMIGDIDLCGESGGRIKAY